MHAAGHPRTAARAEAIPIHGVDRCAEFAANGAQPRREKGIAFFGNFGTNNIGNEYTLESILENVRRHVPGAPLTCICTDPENVTAQHGVPASLISYRFSRTFRASAPGPRSPLLRMLRRLFVRVPREMLELWRGFRALQNVGALVMAGTGMLSDVGIGPLDLHYEILKWSILAKLRGAKLFFVSVGVGPIADPLSRWIVKRALSLADYRSYRDAWSKAYLDGIGFDTGEDVRSHDLAFSLAPRIRAGHESGGRVVGVGVMDYYGTHASPVVGEDCYRGYVRTVAAFVSWLLERGYTVRLLIGDLSYDTRSRDDVLRLLGERGTPGQVIEVPIGSTTQLVEAIAGTDVVVATRFHTLLLGMMMGKPVLALSYHQKIVSLMESVGLTQYCHDVDEADIVRLIAQFTELERNGPTIRSRLAQKGREFGRALEEQYGRLFGHRQTS